MNAEKFKHKEEQLKQAILRLGEIVNDDDPIDDRDRDAMIQRFEFTIELYWKVLKMKLENEGDDLNSPKSIFSKAYAYGWLSGGEEDWLQMLKDRNLSSHTYNEPLAIEIADRIDEHYLILYHTYDNLFGF